jgi:hypothetical protein
MALSRTALLLLACLAFPPVLHARAADSRLVLVAGAHSPIARLSADEARRLYLGMPMLVDGKPVHPLRNNSDAMVQEMFMQKVMYMSTAAYERQIMSRVFRAGGSRPPVYTEAKELLGALESDPAAVTYLPRDQAMATPKLRIVGEP